MSRPLCYMHLNLNSYRQCQLLLFWQTKMSSGQFYTYRWIHFISGVTICDPGGVHVAVATWPCTYLPYLLCFHSGHWKSCNFIKTECNYVIANNFCRTQCNCHTLSSREQFIRALGVLLMMVMQEYAGQRDVHGFLSGSISTSQDLFCHTTTASYNGGLQAMTTSV